MQQIGKQKFIELYSEEEFRKNFGKNYEMEGADGRMDKYT